MKIYRNLRELTRQPKLENRRKLRVTNIEMAASKASDNLSKTIKYLYKTDLSESVREKMIRNMIKNNLIEFFKFNSNTKEASERGSSIS